MNKCIIYLIILFPLSFSLITANTFAENISLKNKKEKLASLAPVIKHEAFKLVGEGTMRWFWFDIYQAKLFSPSGKYHPQQWPISLELIYVRNISSKELIQSTADEWQRQSINYQEEWLTQLNRIWPNVVPGDKLLLNVNEEGHSCFFYNNQYIGCIYDTVFSHAFTSIWLSENTLKPGLRNQLIGLKP